MSRIAEAFKSGKAFIPFMTCGDPDLETTAAAVRAGDWSSTRAREGLWHKAGMILAVVVSVLGDLLLGVLLRACGLAAPFRGVLLAPLVTAWYCLTELGSVVENAGKLGAPVPGWLRKLLRRGVEAVDDAGESAAGGEDGHDV